MVLRVSVELLLMEMFDSEYDMALVYITNVFS